MSEVTHHPPMYGNNASQNYGNLRQAQGNACETFYIK